MLNRQQKGALASKLNSLHLEIDFLSSKSGSPAYYPFTCMFMAVYTFFPFDTSQKYSKEVNSDVSCLRY